jgi:hypothetical protein
MVERNSENTTMLRRFAFLLTSILSLSACGESAPTVPLPAAVTAATEGRCAELGLPADAFQTDAGGFAFGDVAGDFTVTELDGSTWTLSERWTGCESYVFITYLGDAGSDTLWATSPARLFEVGTPNVHYFFMSIEPEESARRARLSAMQVEVDGAIDATSDPVGFRSRVHFVADRASDVSGSVGPFLTDYIAYAQDPNNVVDLGDRGLAPAPLPYAFGIDREQRWDPGGSLSPVVGRPIELSMAAYYGEFYNHRAALRHRLEAEAEATTAISLVEESVTERVFVRTAATPARGLMRQFDTLEVHVEVNCPFRNPFACSEWDRIARISVCQDGEECMERRELVRWITPYWRRGRRAWTIDASPLLPLLGDGDEEISFHVEMGPSWERATMREATIELLLTRRDRPRAIAAEYLFGGGSFDAAYNDRSRATVEAPPNASRAELVAILSGHGQNETTNCAEWCDHRHRFEVNDNRLPTIAHGAGVGSLAGCADLAGEGVPPGQWGNWAPERAYWCPGLPVQPIRLDVTDAVALGAMNSVGYSAQYAPPGGSPSGTGGGNISLSSYLVFYE